MVIQVAGASAGILAGKHGRSGGHTDRTIADHLVKTKSIPRQLINIRGLNFLIALAAD